LFTPSLPDRNLNMLIPVAAAAVVLAAALSAYVVVKFYGVVFLGQPREEKLAGAHDAGPWERVGLAWLAAGCVVLGVLPVHVVRAIDFVTELLLGSSLSKAAGPSNWLFLAPINPDRASYSPLGFLAAIAVATALAWIAVRRFFHGRTRRAPPWDCGFPHLNSRMQDTAEGFGQPVKQMFDPFFRIESEVPSPFDATPRYRARIDDRAWDWFYAPIGRAVEALTEIVTVLQRGRISVYLMYSFGTLLLLLWFAT
jgi:hydrogenase-4 component B